MSNDVLSGCRVLVVEDEALIAMVLEDMLDMLGCTLVGTANSVEEAQELIANSEFDVAILDVNLGREPVYPIADIIDARGVPIIFATGSHRDTLPDRFSHCQVLEKPYTFPAVEATLLRAVTSSDAIRAAGQA